MGTASHVAAIRHFNRTYTRHVGAVNGKSLPKGYSLPELHILHAIAQKPDITAKELTVLLDMDAGYLSRILTRLVKRKLVTRTPSVMDKRQLHLKLTPTGLQRFNEVEAFANHYVSEQLASLVPAKRDTMVKSMQTILNTINEDPSAPIIFRQLKLGDAGWIVHRHGALIAPEFGWDTRFEALCARILADFIDQYQPAWERSYVVERNGDILGSLFLVRHDAETAKLRLLYVEPAARGMGLATKLLEKAIQFARSKHYKRVTLFTTSNNLAARRLYDAVGFKIVKEEVQDFCGMPLTEEHWELMLA
ncbi:MAG: bifunctional helix-turn-helix transcriptional regulator/GNAT family N-acetyltransferase [Alphaproteobacteria bacterium]|nr:bifunctional helix-turn-helix transcriptional regulator/GNAT family N-acetyltransferase [Alphaproteobacteria bacterium]